MQDKLMEEQQVLDYEKDGFIYEVKKWQNMAKTSLSYLQSELAE